MEKQIEYQDLMKLSRLAQEIAALHVKYIKEGVEISAIANTFATIYYRQLKSSLDDGAMKIINNEMAKETKNFGVRSLDPGNASANICIRMSSGFIKAVCKMLSSDNPVS